MEKKSYDVLVIGGGAAGLAGALELTLTGKTVAVIEAKNRLGGRMHTILDGDLPIELGAEFVHGNLPNTQRHLKNAGIATYKVDGSVWQYKNGKLSEQEDFIEDFDDLAKKCKKLDGDKTVADFLEDDLQGDKYDDLRFSLKNYVEGYYAADVHRASTKALCTELTEGEDEQFRVEGGYHLLVDYLEQTCRSHGVEIFLSNAVQKIEYKKGTVTAITGAEMFTGQKMLMTVPLGVLQKEALQFLPALSDVHKKAIQHLGFGHVIKIVLHFSVPFWKEGFAALEKGIKDLGFLFSQEAIPTWWTHYPKNDAVLVGWLGGPRADELQLLTEKDVVQKALSSLGAIVGIDVVHLQQKVVQAHFYNWSADPHVYGAYGYEVVDGNAAINNLLQPVEDTVFFAGEALHPGPEIGTVEGALASGREVAHRMIASFGK